MEIQNKELHRITSTAIIYRDGRYLITKRSPNKKSFPDRWTVPGGGLEVTDYINFPKNKAGLWYNALDKSLRREIKEEVNLEVGDLKYLLEFTFIRHDNIPVITFSFYCDWKSGEVKLNEENVDYQWVTLEEAKNYDLISGVFEEIEMVDKILKAQRG